MGLLDSFKPSSGGFTMPEVPNFTIPEYNLPTYTTPSMPSIPNMDLGFGGSSPTTTMPSMPSGGLGLPSLGDMGLGNMGMGLGSMNPLGGISSSTKSIVLILFLVLAAGVTIYIVYKASTKESREERRYIYQMVGEGAQGMSQSGGSMKMV